MLPSRVLIVTFSYWPTLNARAFRWTALAERWASQGARVEVVSAWSPGLARHEVVNGVVIRRPGSRAVETLRNWLTNRRQAAVNFESTSSRYESKLRQRMLSGLRHLNDQIWRKVFWPDSSCPWYFSALREARRAAQSLRPDVLISVSPTFTAVAVARRLIGELHSTARWLIDLGDPFCFCEEAPQNNFRLYRRLNRVFERACFRRATAVSVTTAATRARYAELFPESVAKMHVIAPLLSLPDLPVPESPKSNSARTIVYVGTLYGSIRRPDFLLALFAQLRRAMTQESLELHVYGDVRDCASCFEPFLQEKVPSVFLHGTVARSQALQAMANASVLVNLGNDTAYQLPSKILEYLAVGRPILNIATHSQDSSTAFLADYPLAVSLQASQAGPTATDVAKVAQLLRRRPEPGDRSIAEPWLAPSRINAIAEQYERALGLAA